MNKAAWLLVLLTGIVCSGCDLLKILETGFLSGIFLFVSAVGFIIVLIIWLSKKKHERLGHTKRKERLRRKVGGVGY